MTKLALKMAIQFQVITPNRILFEEEVDQATVLTRLGEITILPGHIPLVSNLVPGEARVKKGSKETPLVIHGGFVEVKKGNRVVVLADGAERMEEMNEQQVAEAVKRAEELKAQKFNTHEYEDAAFALEREQARIRVLKKYREKGYRAGK